MNTKLLTLSLLLPVAIVRAADWPQVGGPRGGYSVEDPGLTWGEPKVAWRFKLTGNSGPGQAVIAGGIVYVLDQHEKDSVAILRGIGLDDGKERWQIKWTTPADTAAESNKRPFGTPAVAGDRIYIVGPAPYRDSAGLRAIDLKTRQVAWVVEPAKDGLVLHASASPIVVDDLVLVNVKEAGKDAVLALDRATGAKRWKCALPFIPNGTGVMQNAPQLAVFDGVRQIVVHHPNGVTGVSLDGKVLWTNAGYQRKTLTATPSVSSNGFIYVSSGHEGSCAMFRVTRVNGAWQCATVFADGEKQKGEMQEGLNLPHLIFGNWNIVSGAWWNRHLFAVGTKGLHCLDETGRVVWTSGENPGKPGWNPCVIAVNDRLLHIAGNGRKAGNLVVAEANATGYKQLGEVKVHSKMTVTQLAYSNGRVVSQYEDDGELVCVELGTHKP